MFTKRLFISLLVAFGLALPVAAQVNGSLRPDGLHYQDWFYTGTVDMSKVLAQAGAENKGMVVIFEQKGCPYCVLLHKKNFSRAEISGYMKENFITVQLDIDSGKMITDFDGTLVSQSELSDRWGIVYTPTTAVFKPTKILMDTRRDSETFRLPGYIKPFYYLSAFEYLISGSNETLKFNVYLNQRVAELTEKGIDPELW